MFDASNAITYTNCNDGFARFMQWSSSKDFPFQLYTPMCAYAVNYIFQEHSEQVTTPNQNKRTSTKSTSTAASTVSVKSTKPASTPTASVKRATPASTPNVSVKNATPACTPTEQVIPANPSSTSTASVKHAAQPSTPMASVKPATHSSTPTASVKPATPLSTATELVKSATPSSTPTELVKPATPLSVKPSLEARGAIQPVASSLSTSCSSNSNHQHSTAFNSTNNQTATGQEESDALQLSYEEAIRTQNSEAVNIYLEIIKITSITLKSYTKLFNLILKSGCYPKFWEQSYVILFTNQVISQT